MKKIIYAILFLLLIIPSASWSYTYQDVQTFVDNNPAPEGCMHWVEEVTTAEGSGSRVWERCDNTWFEVSRTYYGSGPYNPPSWSSYPWKLKCDGTEDTTSLYEGIYYNNVIGMMKRYFRSCQGSEQIKGFIDGYPYPPYLSSATCEVFYSPTYDCSVNDVLLAEFIPIETCSDNDGDGYDAFDAASCPEGNDCNDSNAAIHPAAAWYRDADGDGYTDGTIITQCESAAGYKLVSELTSSTLDCDDNDPSVNLETTWHRDADGDGYPDGTALTQCERPLGYKLGSELSSSVTDCNDSDPLVNIETPWYQDLDNDGYSDGTTITQCERPAGFRRILELTSTTGDCNDDNGTVNPGAEEICGDNEDNNCDGQGDEVFDQDNDGYRTCDGDCNDLSASINPGAAEICYDSIDNNCYEGVDETCYECAMNKEIGSSANIGSGNLFQSQDTHIASLNMIYNSRDNTRGPLGRGWTHTYNIYIKQPAIGSLLVTYGDGKRVYFFNDGSGIYHPAPGTGDHSSIASYGSGYHLTRKDGTKYIFDAASGRLIEISDRNNNKTTLSYTGSNLTSVTDQTGRVTAFTYNTPGLIEGITDHFGRITTLLYDENGYLSRVTNPQGNAYQYSYDSEGRMLTKTDPVGNTITYGYDIFNRVVSSTTPSGTKTISYDQTTNTATITDQNGGLWQYTYNSILNVIVKTVDPAGNITTRAYDENRNLVSETDPVGNITTFTYDGSGNVLTMTNPAGQTSTYTYNPFGQVTSITGSDGNTTTYTYDPEGNLLSATDPNGAATRYRYDTRGNVTQVTNAGGHTTTFTYDAYNNVSSITDPTGNITAFVYDAVGNLLSVTDPSGAVTVFEYNNLNQLIRMSEPNGKITTFTYDVNGNRTSQTDANGNTTFFEYDYRDQLIRVTDAIGGATAYTYGGSGCPSCGGGGEYLTSMTDANGNTTNYHYNTSGMLVSETDPLGNTTSYTYDAVGNLISKTDGNGNTTTYTYDVLNRLTRKSYGDGTQTVFTYDNKGNILTASNQHITYAFTYDANNRVTGVSDTIGHSVAYQYDALGNSTRMTSSDGRAITYSYDVANRLAQIISGAETFGFGYDASGRRMSLTYPNGVTASYSYDQGGRLTGLVHASASEQVDSITYTHDGIGNRLSRTTLDNKNLYTYDKLNRLIQSLPIKFQGKGKEHPKKASDFTYDPVGNRRTGPERNDYYNYNQGNQLTNDRKHQYVYDGNGNLITKTETDDDGETEIWTYAYDGENRLISAVEQEEVATETVTFKYDPFGRRIEKAVTEGSTTTIKRYFYDNEDILFEYDESGVIGNRYTHGPGIDEPLSVTTDSGTYYYHADGLGTITTLTDRDQKVVQEYEYDAFGNLHDEKNTVKQPYTYTGREWDKETKLYYYRARYYDAEVGRFISKDPIGFRGGMNLYSYVGQNPVNYGDPYGLFSTLDAVYHYFIGGGSAVTVNFAEVDAGLQPRDFPGYQDLVNSMYRQNGTLSVDKKTSKDIGGWAGHITYRLKGTIKSTTCEWKFSGYVGAHNDTFNFDALPWGERAYWAEIITRLIGALPAGTAYDIRFNGNRAVTDGGTW